MGPREGRRVRDQERRQQDEPREALGVQILREAPFKEARTSFRHTTGCTEPGRRRQSSFAGTPRHTPADVKARLQQEMSITLQSIAERETSEVIQLVRQEEDHVARTGMENAGVELSMMVESGQLKLAFPRVPAWFF